MTPPPQRHNHFVIVMEHKEQHVVYKELGLPILVRRNLHAYEALQVVTEWPPNRDQRRLYDGIEQHERRSQTRWYYYSGRRRYCDERRRLGCTGKKSAKENEPEPRVQPELQQQRRLLLMAKNDKDNDDSDMILKSYRLFDHPYTIPTATTTKASTIRKRNRENEIMARQRYTMDPAYLAPMGFDAIQHCCDDDDGDGDDEDEDESFKESSQYPLNGSDIDDDDDDDGTTPTRNANKKTKRRTHHKRQRRPNESREHSQSKKFGNCLVCFPCPTTKRRRWLLLYPTGELLSKVTVSILEFPFGMTEKQTPTTTTRHELEIGEQILQIEPCDLSSSSDGVYFVVRSDNYVTVVCLTLRAAAASSKQQQPRPCYDIQEIVKMNLRSTIDVACHGNYGNTLTPPRIAMLLRSSSGSVGGNNTIAVPKSIGGVILQTTQGLPWLRKKHTMDTASAFDFYHVSNLSNISLIEFSSTSPNMLWSAATSYVRPKLSLLGEHLGHGHSIYSIDLRASKGVCQWSPSADGFVAEGVHHISGIKTDWGNSKPHTLWASSSSAGKLWELDARMPFRVVNSWSLPGQYNDFGKTRQSALSSWHGSGTIISLPNNSDGVVVRPVVTVEKTPESPGLSIYQPAIHHRCLLSPQQSLEVPNVAGFEKCGKQTTVVRSAVFDLPDVSPRVFTCGLGTFRTSLCDFLEEQDDEQQGKTVFGAITMTNKGDLYCQNFLECAVDEEPVVPEFTTKPAQHHRTTNSLSLFLSDDTTPVIASHQMAPVSSLSKNQYSPFTTLDLDELVDDEVSSSSSEEETCSVEEMHREEFVTIPPGGEKKNLELTRDNVGVVKHAGDGGDDHKAAVMVVASNTIAEEAQQELEELKSSETMDTQQDTPLLRIANQLWSSKFRDD